MNVIEMVAPDEVKACGFKPEPHTVSFTGAADPGDTYYAYKIDGRIAGVLTVANKHGGKYIGKVFTDFPYRGRGIATKLIKYIIMQEYPGEKFIAHALITSKRIFERLGFECYKTVPFKHGTQYFMKMEVE